MFGKQAVYIPQISKAAQRKYYRQRKQINIVTSVHDQQFPKVFGNQLLINSRTTPIMLPQ